MKLSQLINISEDTDKAPPKPGPLGNLLTTAQVAAKFDLDPSRIRQYKDEGKIKPVEGPVPGHQESLYTTAEVERFGNYLKKVRENKGGRPPKPGNK